MKDHLIFDTTDVDTINDTDSVGAYVRSGDAGALITHHSPVEAGDVAFDFVDGDVTVGTDTINETAHGLLDGDVIQLTSTGTLPAGLALATDYYVIRVDADNFKLAASAKDSEEGVAVDITAAAGGGTHTLTEQEVKKRALDVWMVNPIDVNITQADEITVYQGTSPWVVSATDLDIRDLLHTQDSIRLGDGTAFFTSTSENSDIALDVHISNTEIAVVQGSDSPWSIDDNGGSITVDGTIAATQSGTWTVGLSEDHNYGAVGANTLRTAAQIGNATGAADFGSGVTTAQTLRVALATDTSFNTNDAALANTAIANAANFMSVANTAEDVVASPLASRKYLWIYNFGNKKAYIGATGVSDANGFPLSPGSYMEMRAGAAVDIEWVSADTSQQIRTLELS